jgi:large subunit ribosomal protein L24
MAGIRKGDTVTVLSGKDRGKSGKVLQVWPVKDQALVERVNLVKHFERRTQQNQAGGIVEREAALPLAKLSLVCPRCHKPTRLGWRLAADGSKQRVCSKCEGALE